MGFGPLLALLRRSIVVTAERERRGVASMQWKFEIQFIKVSKGIEGVLEFDGGGGGGRVEGTNSGKTSRCGRMVAAATPDRDVIRRFS